jgi:DNA-directed RNA polymerase subunit K/omega
MLVRVRCFLVSKGKRKPSKFTAAREARRRARELAGPPPVQRVIPDKRLKPAKHKKQLIENSEQ